MQRPCTLRKTEFLDAMLEYALLFGIGSAMESKVCLRCKTIGLIGGMSWESSSEYYRLLNESVRAHMGGLNSAPCLLMSVKLH